MKLNRSQFVAIAIAAMILIPLIYIGGFEGTLRLRDEISLRCAEPQMVRPKNVFDPLIDCLKAKDQLKRLIEIVILLTLFVSGSGAFTVFLIEGKKEGMEKLSKGLVLGIYVILYTLLCVAGYRVLLFMSGGYI